MLEYFSIAYEGFSTTFHMTSQVAGLYGRWKSGFFSALKYELLQNKPLPACLRKIYGKSFV